MTQNARHAKLTIKPAITDPFMSDTPPDRLCVNPKSPYYDEALLERGVGIRFAGKEKTNVEEYCVSEGWVRLAAGNARTRTGEQMTVKLKGKVEPYFRDIAASDGVSDAEA